MKRPRKYSKEIRETWATWEVMRRLGFPADDLFWEFAAAVQYRGAPALFLKLATQGRVFRIVTDPERAHQERIDQLVSAILDAVGLRSTDDTERTLGHGIDRERRAAIRTVLLETLPFHPKES